MAVPGVVEWHPSPLISHVRLSVRAALKDIEDFGHSYWMITAPVSTDPRTRGGLRSSWNSDIHDRGQRIVLTFGASAPYAVYVELGTYKTPPQAPLRGTAGEMAAIAPYSIAASIKST